MANDYFRFRHFTVYHDRCAMKVGTDGTLLGAWARGGQTVLDIGTGTGLIALMMAQRFPDATIWGIDIDSEAVGQARANVAGSPFRNIGILEADVRTFTPIVPTACLSFDAIVSNPPYFDSSLECPDGQRTLARHTASLSYRDLMQSVCRLLADGGEFSVVIPFDCKARMEAEATLAGLFKVRECAVKTTPRKQSRRYLMAFRKHPADLELEEGVIETSPNVRSSWYQELTKDFYL